MEATYSDGNLTFTIAMEDDSIFFMVETKCVTITENNPNITVRDLENILQACKIKTDISVEDFFFIKDGTATMSYDTVSDTGYRFCQVSQEIPIAVVELVVQQVLDIYYDKK